MNVRVRTFARIRELLKFDARTVNVPDDATIEVVWRSISAPIPDAGAIRSSLRFARNGSIVEAQTRLQDGDEVAVLPPSSGG
ncbi:MAG: MoaD/ThiS family protein [Candidatus Eremiobacteraeota bacterium]|nr:MoaD/ThiS family protein [Candidatus Eremiobacteraeota bacterium]